MLNFPKGTLFNRVNRYITNRQVGEGKKLEILGRVYQLGFKILPVPDILVFKAAELKAEYAISYAAGDPEFKKVTTPVNIHWIC